jgi:class 3 adenylate cyclase/tetratricopeptide (TPR) repeat protein
MSSTDNSADMKTTTLTLVVTILLLFNGILQAQNAKIDSLLQVLENTPEDTHRVNLLNDLCWQLINTGNYEQAITRATDAQYLAKELSYHKGMASSHNNIGITHLNQGNYPEAMKNYLASLKIREEIGDRKGISISYSNIAKIQSDQGNYPEAIKNNLASLKIREEIGDRKGMAISNNNIGVIQMNQGNYSEAMKSYKASLKIKEEIGDRKGMAGSYINIGIILKNQGNYPETMKNYLAALKIYEEISDRKGVANSYNNIGIIYKIQGNYPEAMRNYLASVKIEEEIGNKNGMARCYSNIGNIHMEQGNYSEAMKYYLASLKIEQEIGDKKGMAGSFNNIGIIHKYQGNYPEAMNNYLAGLKIREEIGDRWGMASSYSNIGKLNIRLGNHTSARLTLTKGLKLAKEISAKDQMKSMYEGLVQLDSVTGNWQGAYLNHLQYMLYRDSLFNEENTKKQTQFEMQYEFDKKEAATQAEQDKKDAVAEQELKRQTMARNGFMGGFAIVLLFAGVFFVQRNRIGKEKQRSDELLLNILPEEVADELKENGHSDAQFIDHVTVLFTDFKGFTALSEKVTPKELVADLHECFSAFDNICEKYGIEKIKTIGDAYMAAGGLPSPNTTHAQDVVNAALEMAEVVEQGKTQKIEQGLPFFEIRIGIHTGPVVAGIVGVKKFQYDIWGDTVNTASRMESSGEVGKVNISEATYELINQEFSCEYRGEIEAKGKGKLGMYFISTKIEDVV